MNPIQKYPHIIESSACILNMLVFVFLCPISLLISLGTCSTPKLSNFQNYQHQTSLFFPYKAIQCVSTSAYSSGFITCAPFFISLDKLSLE